MNKIGIEFKKRLLAGEILLGTHTSLSDFTVTEIYGYYPFDYVWIDTEHSAIDYQVLNTHILAAHARGLAAVVRIPLVEPFLAKRVLEMGPDGIIFPMVNTPELAREAMSYCLYPPKGNRGFGPARAAGYGAGSLGEYLSTIDDSLCRFVQIEQKEGADNLDEILKVPHIDGFVIGPMDLSFSIGESGNMFAPRNLDLIKEVLGKIKAAGKAVGTSVASTRAEDFKIWHDLGMQFISAGGDVSFIKDGCAKLLGDLKAAFGT